MLPATEERVPQHTDEAVNEQIRMETDRNIAYYKTQDRQAIEARLDELSQEWDIERTLEANAAGISLFGLFMATFIARKWIVLPVMVSGFLLQHALQGWCPPVPVFRRMGFRTCLEIERERQALMEARESAG
jgi:hypothetical protein